jgi:hypothetical protein
MGDFFLLLLQTWNRVSLNWNDTDCSVRTCFNSVAPHCRGHCRAILGKFPECMWESYQNKTKQNKKTNKKPDQKTMCQMLRNSEWRKFALWLLNLIQTKLFLEAIRWPLTTNTRGNYWAQPLAVRELYYTLFCAGLWDHKCMCMLFVIPCTMLISYGLSSAFNDGTMPDTCKSVTTALPDEERGLGLWSSQILKFLMWFRGNHKIWCD